MLSALLLRRRGGICTLVSVVLGCNNLQSNSRLVGSILLPGAVVFGDVVEEVARRTTSGKNRTPQRRMPIAHVLELVKAVNEVCFVQRWL